MPARTRRERSLGTKILYGVLAGIALGLLLGELSAPLKTIGDVYVGLLQMTVLPYVLVSLILKVGGLTFEQAGRLATRALFVLIALWAIALTLVAVMPLSLPEWEAGTFFSESLVTKARELDFLELYLPINLFESLARNVVPAVVVFAIFLGGALIGVPGKERLLDPLAVVSAALGRVSNFVTALSPYGTFALTAGAAGALYPDEFARLSGYVGTFTLAVIVAAFVALPGLVAALTPIRYGQLMRSMRDSLLTAFATGKLFAVLQIIIADVKRLLAEQGVDEEEAQATADLFVPLGYPFPGTGKILSMVFIPFAAWYIGHPLDPAEYPILLSVGLFSFFGNTIAAITFLLTAMRLPMDLFPLFLVGGIWCSRLGDALGAVHLTVFTLLCSAWDHGWVRLRAVPIGIWLGASALATVLAMFANYQIVSATMLGQPRTRDVIASMDLWNRIVEIEVDETSRPSPDPILPGETHVDRIRRSGELRVGFVSSKPPFCFQNSAGLQVGLEVDLAHRLASDLGVTLRLVPTTREQVVEGLAADHYDFAIGEIASSVRRFGEYRESSPYLYAHGAVLTLHERAAEFRTLDSIRQMAEVGDLRLGYETGGMLIRTGLQLVDGAFYVEAENAEAYARGDLADEKLDGFVMTAESAAVVSMLFPRYAVVVPEGHLVEVPMVFALPEDDDQLARLVDRWIALKQSDGTLDVLYDHWILGKQKRQKAPRWSVLRDVLGWVK